MIGLLFCMFDVLFKVGEKFYQNRIIRVVLAILFLETILVSINFLLDYDVLSKAFDFRQEKYSGLFFELLKTTYHRFTGQLLPKTPVMIVFSSIIGSLIMYGIIYLFRKKIVTFWNKYDKTIFISFDTIYNEVVLEINNKKKTKIRFSFEDIRDIFSFIVLFDIEFRLGLFQFWIYWRQLPFAVIMVFLGLIMVLIPYFLSFLMKTKKIAQYIAIQSLFFDLARYEQVIFIFEEYIETGQSFITLENYNLRTKLFQDLEIINTVEKVDLRLLIEVQQIPVEISDTYLELYEKQLEEYLISIKESHQ